jgi:hypothetical protein
VFDNGMVYVQMQQTSTVADFASSFYSREDVIG